MPKRTHGSDAEFLGSRAPVGAWLQSHAEKLGGWLLFILDILDLCVAWRFARTRRAVTTHSCVDAHRGQYPAVEDKPHHHKASYKYEFFHFHSGLCNIQFYVDG